MGSRLRSDEGRVGLDPQKLWATMSLLPAVGRFFFVSCVMTALILNSPAGAGAGQIAFPTATGKGAMAKGGRGGRVIFVTTLDEFGPGSLRACIEGSGPRTCIFRISGTVTLAKQSLVATRPYLTIAGETAPGDGIAIRNGPEQVRPSVEIKTHDVIIRFLRLRPGPHSVESCCSGALGLYTAEAHDIIIDHVSASWGSDETIDSEDATNVTFQWCIFSEPLLNGGPGKKNRARNMLLTRGGNFTVSNSLFALGKFRNPQIAPAIAGSTIDIVNNVFYSPVWDYVISFDSRWAPVRANILGNYKIAGAKVEDDRLVHLFEAGGLGFQLLILENYDETYDLARSAPQIEALAPGLEQYVTSEPQGELPVWVEPAKAYDAVLGNAGATRPKRDSVDNRVIDAVAKRSGALLKNSREGGRMASTKLHSCASRQ